MSDTPETPKKEKLAIYMDDKGKRRDPNRSGHPILCDAKSKRTGEMCKNIARANGKCRNHGGNSTGPKTAEGRRRISEANSKHKFKTGENTAIWFDQLRDDELAMIAEIPSDAAALLDQEIKLTTVRERRMMAHIYELEDRILDGQSDEQVQENWKRQILRDEKDEPIYQVDGEGVKRIEAEYVLSNKLVIKNDLKKQIQGIEEALTRVQAHKVKLIELKSKLDAGNIEEEDGSLSQLVAIIGKARDLRSSRSTGV